MSIGWMAISINSYQTGSTPKFVQTDIDRRRAQTNALSHSTKGIETISVSDSEHAIIINNDPNPHVAKDGYAEGEYRTVMKDGKEYRYGVNDPRHIPLKAIEKIKFHMQDQIADIEMANSLSTQLIVALIKIKAGEAMETDLEKLLLRIYNNYGEFHGTSIDLTAYGFPGIENVHIEMEKKLEFEVGPEAAIIGKVIAKYLETQVKGYMEEIYGVKSVFMDTILDADDNYLYSASLSLLNGSNNYDRQVSTKVVYKGNDPQVKETKISRSSD